MSEPDFTFFSLPEFLLADIDDRIGNLRNELPRRDPTALLEPLQHLSRIRGNFAFDLISSIAWAAGVLCGNAVTSQRELTPLELRSLSHAIDSMDRARRTALLAAAV